jgi:hypothetical protein
MNDASMWAEVVKQLMRQGPSLLVQVGGIILAIMWWKRWPRPAMLVVVGLIIQLLVIVGTSLSYLVLPNISSVTGVRLLTLMWSVLYAVGTCVLIGAAFAARAARPTAAFPVAARPAPPPPPPRPARS